MGRQPRTMDAMVRWKPVLFVAIVLVLGSAVPAWAQETDSGQSEHPVVHALLQAMYGENYFIARDAPGTPDPAGDAATLGGEARPDVLDLLFVEWFIFSATETSFFEYLCGELGTEGALEAVCPLDRRLFDASEEFLFVYALTGGVVDRDSFLQFVFAWAEPALAPYQGAPNDINTGRTRSKEIWQPTPGAGLQPGATTWDGSAFGFDPNHGGVIGIFGDNMVALLIPRTEFAQQCLNVAVSLVTQPGVADIAELADEPDGTVLAAPPEPEATTTPPAPTTTASPAAPVDNTAVAADSPAVTLEPLEEGSGVGGWGLVAAALLLVGLGTGTLIRRRRRAPPGDPCREEKQRWNDALDEAEAAGNRRRLAQEALHEVEVRQGPIRVSLDNASLTAPRPGEYDDPATFEAARAAHQASTEEHQRQFDALESLRVPLAAAYEEADAESNAAGEAETAARIAYQDCMSRQGASQSPPAVGTPPEPNETTTTPTPPGVVEPGTGGTAAPTPTPPATGVSKPTEGCTPEWRPDPEKTGPVQVVLGDTVTITLNHSTQRFRLWLDAHGTLEVGDTEDESQWEPATGSFPVRHLEKWEGRKAEALFLTKSRAYDVEFKITLSKTEQFPQCLRLWDCDAEGNLFATDKFKLGPRQTVGGSESEFVIMGTAISAQELATRLTAAYQSVINARSGERQIEAWETENCF